MQETGASVSWATETNKTYTVDFCTDLEAEDWATLDNVVGDGDSVKVIDTDDSAARFYRVREVEPALAKAAKPAIRRVLPEGAAAVDTMEPEKAGPPPPKHLFRDSEKRIPGAGIWLPQ